MENAKAFESAFSFQEDIPVRFLRIKFIGKIRQGITPCDHNVRRNRFNRIKGPQTPSIFPVAEATSSVCHTAAPPGFICFHYDVKCTPVQRSDLFFKYKIKLTLFES